MGVEACLKYITLSESAISSYFGDRQIRLSKLALEIFYVDFFAAFGNVAGIPVSLNAELPKKQRGRPPKGARRRCATSDPGSKHLSMYGHAALVEAI